MKKIFSVVLCLLLAILFYPEIVVSSSQGSGAGGGNTGSPADMQNCTSCHSGVVNSGTGSSSISSNIPVTGYVPGNTYSITIDVAEAGISKFGFELTAEDSNDNKIGNFIITNSTETQLTNSNTAVTHTINGNAGSSGSKTWSVDWQAPNAGSGDVTFYSASLMANYPSNTSGDQVYTQEVMFSEQISTPGCTDPAACNYDPLATVDDGSCIYAAYFITQPQDDTVFMGANHVISVDYVNGAGMPFYQWYMSNMCDFSSGIAITGANSSSYTVNTTLVGVTYYYCVISFSMVSCDSIVSNCAEMTVMAAPNYGCTDSVACNYDPLANTDDGSCLYATMSTTQEVAYNSYTWNGITYDTSGIYYYNGGSGANISGFNYGGYYEGSHYYVSQSAVVWTEADSISNSLGGHLVVISDSLENDFILNSGLISMSSIAGGPFIGLFQNSNNSSYSEPSGGWEWVTGEPLNYTNWSLNEPSNGGVAGEDFTQILIDGTWNDIPETTWNPSDSSITGAYTGYFILEIPALLNSNGCDSTAILDLTILDGPEYLFFSEAAEGSGNNKYFEVYNPTGDTIDLTHYAFARVTNAPGNGVGVYEAWVDFDSAAFIAPNDVYVVCHTGSGWSPVDPIILAEADMDYGSMSNGDDGFALVYGIEPATPMSPNNGGYYVLDWIGDWNGDPGTGWDVAGVSNATQNHTLVRKCSVLKGDTSWANSAGTDPVNSQWIVLPQNDWSNLGFHNLCPCDSTTNSYTSIIDTICSGQSITVGSSVYDSTGIYSDTLLAFNGCDSIISTHLTVLITSASSTNISLSICDGDSVMVGATYYHSSGIYTQVLTNSSGCDSAVTLNLIVQNPISWNVTICDGDSIVVGNSVYYNSGNYTDTIISSIGCDSIINTNLTIYSQFNPIYGGIQDSSIGAGGFYSGSQHLEMSCYMSSELISAVVYAEDTVSETFEIRDVNGNVLSDTFVTVFPGGHRVYFNYHMIAGLDYQLGVNGNSNDLYRNNSGVSYPYNFGSLASLTSSSAGGNYYYFFYDIEVRQSSQPANYSICDGDSVVVGGSVYTTTGLYTDSLISSIGCDSLVLTNLVVYPNIIDTNQQTICVGEIYSVGGNIYDSSGVYIDSLQTEFGCDSIIITDLLVDTLTVGDSIVYANICVGDNYVVGNSIYTNTGTYVDTLIAVNGCDSILTTHLTVNTSNYTPIFGGILDTTLGGGGFFSGSQYLELSCYESSKLVSAVVYAQDSTLTVFEISDNNGNVLADTTYQLYPGANRIYFDYEMTAGSDYQLGVSGNSNNLYRNNTGVNYPYSFGTAAAITSSSAGGNYYYFFYDVEISPYLYEYNHLYICDGDSVQVGSNIYTIAGTYIDTFTSTNIWGCDSIVYTELELYQTPPLSIASLPDPAEICLGDSIILEGSDGFAYYWWSDIDGNILVTDNRLADAPTIDTWYLLTAKDSNDCVVKEDIWVYVDSCILYVDDLNSQIILYPNPVSNKITIDFTEQVTSVKIYNMLGELIIERRVMEGENSIKFSVRDWRSAIYNVQLYNEKGLINKKNFSVVRE